MLAVTLPRWKTSLPWPLQRAFSMQSHNDSLLGCPRRLWPPGVSRLGSAGQNQPTDRRVFPLLLMLGRVSVTMVAMVTHLYPGLERSIPILPKRRSVRRNIRTIVTINTLVRDFFTHHRAPLLVLLSSVFSRNPLARDLDRFDTNTRSWRSCRPRPFCSRITAWRASFNPLSLLEATHTSRSVFRSPASVLYQASKVSPPLRAQRQRR